MSISVLVLVRLYVYVLILELFISDLSNQSVKVRPFAGEVIFVDVELLNIRHLDS